MKKPRKKQRRRGTQARDLLRLITASDPQVSPDGARIVFVHKQAAGSDHYDANLWIVETSGGTPRQFTAGGRDGQPRWSPDGKQLAFVSAREKARPQVWVIPASGGEARALTAFPEGRIGAIKWSPDGSRLATSFRPQEAANTTQAKKEREEKGLSEPPQVIDDWWWRLDGDGAFGGARYALYLVDAATGKHKKIFSRDTLGTFSFDFSPDGKRLALSANTDRKALVRARQTRLLVLDIATGKTRAIDGPPPGPKTAVSWSPDGKVIAYAGRTGTDDIYSTENLELWVCDPKSGKARSLTASTDYCLLATTLTDSAEVGFAPAFVWSRDSKRLFVAVGWHGEQQIASVAVDGSKPRLLTSGERHISLGNLSRDGQLVALSITSATAPPEIHLGRIKAGSIATTALTNLNAELLTELELSQPRSHWLESTDGASVQVWELLPPGTRAKSRKLPAVLEIHGGPHAQYGVPFFHELQVLAAAGYAVYYSNPRGSKGYGRDHCAAIRGCWGTKDWDDIQTVTAFMRARSHVDSRRMGIMGGSYGGYMTNWAIGHTNEFRAAITDRCVSNLVSMWGSSDMPMAPDVYWPGNSWDRPEVLWTQSPLAHLGNAKTPTLIIHSEGDLRCNIEQSEQVFMALGHLDVPTRFVRYPRSTSHGMSRAGPPDLRIHRLEQILEWWKAYL